MSSLYIRTLKIFIQIFFLFQSALLIIPASIYRLCLRIVSNKKLHFNPFRHTHEDVFKQNYEIIKMQGYKIVQYQCETMDNAFVNFWRILPQNAQNQSSKRKPVLIQHGLLDCSMSWFLHQNIETCLPYVLTKAGYDVWLGNNRGTKYSSRNSHKQQYWEYTLDHLIKFDIPCMINFILSETGQEKIIYVGHSQGTTQFLTAVDVHSELGAKIQTFVGFGPVISLKHLENHFLIKLMDRLRVCELLKAIGFKTMLIIPNWMSKLIGVLIYNSWFYFKLFLTIVKGLCGSNQQKDRINLQRFGVIISHEPGGSSINNVLHWIQIYREGYLHQFDYGRKANMRVYGQPKPPIYTYEGLKKQSFNIHLFRGTADKVINDRDFNYLLSKLRQEKCTVHLVEDYAHLDYIWSEDAKQDIYQNLVSLLEESKQKLIEQFD